MDQCLKKLRLVRTPIRTKVTKIKNMLSDLDDEKLDGSASLIIQKLEESLRELQYADNRVVDRLSELNEADPDNYADCLLEEEITKNAEIQEEIESFILSKRLQVNACEKATLHCDSTPIVHKSVSLRGPKMPAVKIPFFTGDLLLWQTFWDSFRANIHENMEYSKVAKMAFLKEHVKEEAAEALEHFQITDACYDQAIDLLKSRFGREQDVRFAHMLELLSINQASRNTELRAVIDKVEGHLRCLTTLGFSEKENSELFTCVLLSKIPERVRADFTRRKGPTDWNLPLLRRMLADEVRALDSYKLTNAVNAKDSNSRDKRPSHSNTSEFNAKDRRPQTTNRYHMTTQALVSNDQISCAFCQGSHFSDECKKYSSRQERVNRLTELESCFNCLKKNHKATDCRRTKQCFYCKRTTHHSAICTQRKANSQITTRKTDHVNITPEVDTGNQSSETSLVAASKSLLPIATALIQNDNSKNLKKPVAMKLILDVASGRSYITEKAAKSIGLKPQSHDMLTYASFGSDKSTSRRVPTADIKIKTKNETWIKAQVTIVPVITSPVNKYPVSKSEFPILNTVELAEPIATSPEQVELDILIGLDHYFAFVLKDRIDLTSKLVLMHTQLGWVPAGAIDKGAGSETATSLICPVNKEIETVLLTPNSDNLLQSEESLWALDAIGIYDCAQTTDDELAMCQFNKSVKLIEGRYTVSWPWKKKLPELKSNLGLACGRLKSMLHKLRDRPDTLSKYHETIMEQLERRIIEEVDETLEVAKSREDTTRLVHYLPHHAVYKEDSSTTRIRIVYDASAKTKRSDLSLNECLLKGPTALKEIPGILMRFRLNPVGLVADIEKAFLQVGLHVPDRDVCRFLWPRDPFNPQLRDVRIMRFRRVPFGVISSPFLLSATIVHHVESSNSPYAEDITSNIYVDNVIISMKDETTALDFYSATKRLFQLANMTLREWTSNSVKVVKQIEESERTMQQPVKVLGLLWNQKDDMMSLVELKDKPNPTQILTKRQVLHTASKVFDPLGYTSPVTVRTKLFTQALWKGKYDWDEPLPPDLTSQWNEIHADLNELKDVSWPRFNGIIKEDEVELHAFVDASKDAYGACIFLRKCDEESNVTVSLLLAKNRIAPVKEVTIPRLELMAAVVGVRLVKYVETELKLFSVKKILWSDAKCVLYWIKNDKPKPVFVENRLKEIRQSNVDEFRYVPTKENPADLLSRGITTSLLIDSTLWWNGPDWLNQTTGWPESIILDEKHDTEETYENEDADSATAALVTPEDRTKLPFDLKPEDFSSLQRLVRVTAWCLRAVNAFRKLGIERSEFLSASEIQKARQLWDRSVQEKEFGSLKESIRKGVKTEMVKRLNLFEDETGTIRCGGRIQNSTLCEQTKFPTLLPKNTHYTNLVIRDCHMKIMHQGTKHTLAALRESYWITSGRSQVQKTIKRCITCRKHEGGSFRPPPPPPLPEGRVNRKWPFAITGIDYLGPLLIKSENDIDETKKIWIALFTCGTVRAIHLEIAESLSTQDFIHCLRRFIATRGTPEVIISDNAKQFRLAGAVVERMWMKTLADIDVQSYVANHGISWKFIVQKAPWMGGFYERLVGSVKSCLKKNLGRSFLSMKQLQTLIKEVEATINTRPLTYVDSDLDAIVALTPADFIGAKSSRLGIPEPSIHNQPAQASTKEIVEIWKLQQHFTNMFWESWSKDYLMSLRERNDSKKYRNSVPTSPTINQIVILKDVQRPRGKWKLVKIQALHTSKDGETRSATVSTHNGKLLRRPVQHLIPLEYDDSSTEESSNQEPSQDEPEEIAASFPDEPQGEETQAEKEEKKNEDNLNVPVETNPKRSRKAKLLALAHMF